MNNQIVTVNLVPGLSAPAVIRVSQYDVGRPLTIRVFDGTGAASFGASVTATIVGTKPSGLGFTETGTIAGNTVTLNTTLAMTQERGMIPVEIRFAQTGEDIGTANFILAVEPSPHPDGTTDGTTETARTILEQATEAAQSAQASAETAEAAAEAVTDKYSAPYTVTSASQMTDETKVYLYEGNESGYTAGNWYYYNGSAWVSGGQYGEGVEIDTTLSVSGRAADAKVVGDEISDLKSDLGNIRLTDLFEFGNINITSSGWTYSTSVSRVRTKEGETIHISEGTKIGLTDYTNARYYLGWRNESGIYKFNGWLTTDFTTTESGDYVVLISNRTEVAQTDVTALASLFFGYQAVAFEHINENEDVLAKMETIRFEEYSGFITSNGTVSDASANREVYTSQIPVDVGYRLKISLKYGAIYHGWIAYALYDSNHAFISRPTLMPDKPIINTDFEVDISESNAAFIAFTYRTFDDYTITIKSDDNVHIVDKRIDAVVEKVDDALANNSIIKSVNHRGYYTAPENTLPAYKLSKKNGFKYVECDVSFTSDGIPVLLHDNTINRTARNANGSTISEDININDITYQQALTYDFGIYKGSQYAGTKIPKLEDFLVLCRNLGLHPYVELKSSATYSESQIQSLVDLANRCGMKNNLTWISFNRVFLGYVKNYDATARLGYIVGSISDTTITYVNALMTEENEVFIDCDYAQLTDAMITLCVNANIPLEVWTVDSANAIASLNPYVTGVTSDNLIAGNVLYKANMS